MEVCAECKVCHEGTLLPFYSPEGYVVYFCTNCNTRFSGYYEEPAADGVPIFSERGFYSIDRVVEEGEPIRPGKLMDGYRKLLDENPPLPTEGKECAYCSSYLAPDGSVLDLCVLPKA